MMNTSPRITMRRAMVETAVRRLSPMELRVLLHAVVRACPATGRVWTTHGRLAEELALPMPLVVQVLARLAREGLIDVRPAAQGRLACVELGELLVREETAPTNLPT